MDQNSVSQLVGFAARSPLRHVKLALPTDDTVISFKQQRHILSQPRTAVRLADTVFLVTSNLHTFATATVCPAFSFSSSASVSAASWASCTASRVAYENLSGSTLCLIAPLPVFLQWSGYCQEISSALAATHHCVMQDMRICDADV